MPIVAFLTLRFLLAIPPAPTVAEAIDALDDGRYERAGVLAETLLAAPQTPEQDRAVARLVSAFSSLRASRYGAAASALERVAREGPELGSYLSYLRVMVETRLRRCENATGLAESLAVDSIYSARAWSLVASCWLRSEDMEQADGAIARLESRQDDADIESEGMLLRAELLTARGTTGDARDAYRSLLVTHPLTPAGKVAAMRLAELRTRGHHVRPLGPEELLPRADMEREQQQANRARRTYHAVLRTAAPRSAVELRHQAELGLAELDIVERRYDRALRRIDEVLTAAREADIRAHAFYLQADILARRGRGDEALVAYSAATHETPLGHGLEAALAAGNLAFQLGQTSRARELVEPILSTPEGATGIEVVSADGLRHNGRSATSAHDEARWLLAWIERREGGAPEHMDTWLAGVSDASALGLAARYWRAHVALAHDNVEQAELLINEIIALAPASYYALVGTDLLRRSNPSCAIRPGVPPVETSVDAVVTPRPPAIEPRDLQASLVLFAHGLVGEAMRGMRLVPATRLSQPDRTVAAWIYGRCGDTYRAALLTRRLPQAPRDEVADPVVVALAFPRPYAAEVLDAAARHNVPAELVYAVMRVESNFNPQALSPRYARGLMQMIPPTAKRLAREAELRAFRARHLFRPNVSIELGVRYLAQLITLFDGRLDAAVAAYHAGERNVGQWLARFPDLEPDEFVESIPYASTRQYVQKVLGSYGIYRIVYGSAADQAIGLVRRTDATSARAVMVDGR